MSPNDLLLSAEWGWPDYMEYLYGRRSLSLINNSDEANDRLKELHDKGGKAYMPDPKAYSNIHLEWLQSQSGVSRETLGQLAGPPAFSCYGKTIVSVAESNSR